MRRDHCGSLLTCPRRSLTSAKERNTSRLLYLPCFIASRLPTLAVAACGVGSLALGEQGKLQGVCFQQEETRLLTVLTVAHTSLPYSARMRLSVSLLSFLPRHLAVFGMCAFIR